MAEIEIYSAPNCSHCEAAKALLEKHGLAYREIDVAASAENLEDFKRRLPRERSLPQIFVNGEHIGGDEDLRHAFKSGRLLGITP